mmetsp:Transcript_34334/g.69388  ORF Transcript_34334/g.69388 Transcript_34334/m.69388 type:complete len:164 (-) Transcript_34334:23-514(-)
MASSSKGGRGRSFQPRVVEAFPKERHLTHRFARSLDLQEEFRNVYKDEEVRYNLLFKAPPEPEPRSIFVVPKSDKPRQVLSRSASSRSEPKAAAETAPKRKPGSLRPFEMPQDPTGLPNPHIFRREALETEIAEQEKHLAESRSESTLRSSGGVAVAAPSLPL